MESSNSALRTQGDDGIDASSTENCDQSSEWIKRVQAVDLQDEPSDAVFWGEVCGCRPFQRGSQLILDSHPAARVLALPPQLLGRPPIPGATRSEAPTARMPTLTKSSSRCETRIIDRFSWMVSCSYSAQQAQLFDRCSFRLDQRRPRDHGLPATVPGTRSCRHRLLEEDVSAAPATAAITCAICCLSALL
jgi:hypothetical protein